MKQILLQQSAYNKLLQRTLACCCHLATANVPGPQALLSKALEGGKYRTRVFQRHCATYPQEYNNYCGSGQSN